MGKVASVGACMFVHLYLHDYYDAPGRPKEKCNGKWSVLANLSQLSGCTN